MKKRRRKKLLMRNAIFDYIIFPDRPVFITVSLGVPVFILFRVVTPVSTVLSAQSHPVSDRTGRTGESKQKNQDKNNPPRRYMHHKAHQEYRQ
jgi:hypothetical protein